MSANGRIPDRIGIPLLMLFYFLIVKTAPMEHAGDSHGYVADIIAYHSTGRLEELLEPGHLLWRPTGYVFTRFLSTFLGDRAYEYHTVMKVLQSINWGAGLLFVLSTFLTLKRFVRASIAFVLSVSALSTNAFLNYVHSGCSYIPGLAFLSLAVYLAYALRPESRGVSIVVVVAALCSSVGMWLLYMLSVPAVLLLFALAHKQSISPFALLIRSAVAFTVMITVVYGYSIYLLQIGSTEEFTQWLKSSSHGIENVRGVSRAAFGLARSFLYMQDEGNLVKRFLLKDPYNPVSFLDLVRLSLLKFFLFYFWLLTAVYAVFRFNAGVTPKVVLLAGTFPVAIFAVLWQGGDLERYFPLMPILLVSLTEGLHSLSHRVKLPFVVTAIFIGVLLIVNGPGRTAAVNVVRRESKNRAQLVLDAVRQMKIRSGDVILVPTIHHDIWNLGMLTSPNEVLPRVRWAVLPGHRDAPLWRRNVTKLVLHQWEKGDSIWVSTKLLQPKPKAEWKWVEGDDPRISWRDLFVFFSSLEYTEQLGDSESGLLLLAPTERNKAFLRQSLSAQKD